MKEIRTFLPVVLLVFFGTLAEVQAADYFSPRIAGLAGAGHAGPLLNDAILLNPSFAAFLPTYSSSASYFSYSGPPVNGGGQYGGRNYHLSLQDGRSDLFQAGAAYTVREDGSMFHVGAAKSVLKRMGFGLTGKFYFFNTPTSAKVTGQDLTFSTTWISSDWLQLALIGDNLLENSAAKSHGMYREITLGTKVNLKGLLLLYFDPHVTPSLSTSDSYGFNLGTELVLMSDFFLRLGTMRNAEIPFEAARGRGYGAGIGWVAPRMSLDFGISRAIEPIAATGYSMAATIYF